MDESTISHQKETYHKPQLIYDNNKITAYIGIQSHPMTLEHFIKEVHFYKENTRLATREFGPGDEPKCFLETDNPEGIYAIAICNLHGEWKSEKLTFSKYFNKYIALNTYVKLMFEQGILFEQKAQKLYEKLINLATSKEMKTLFEELHKEEIEHENLFSKLDINKVKESNYIPPKKLETIEKTNPTEMKKEDYQDMKSSIHFAIAREIETAQYYRKSANLLEPGSIKQSFLLLVEQEKKHEKMLRDGLNSLNHKEIHT